MSHYMGTTQHVCTSAVEFTHKHTCKQEMKVFKLEINYCTSISIVQLSFYYHFWIVFVCRKSQLSLGESGINSLIGVTPRSRTFL